MRKDITIARVPWNLKDFAKIIAATFLIPYGLLISVVSLSHYHLLPVAVTRSIKSGDIWFNLIFEVVVVLVEISMILWLVKKYKIGLSDFGLRRFKIFKAALYILLALVMFTALVSIVFIIVTIIFPNFNATQSQAIADEFGTSRIGIILSFVMTVIIAPVIEEIYFRGLMLPAVTKRFGWGMGVIISSSLFAVLHMQANVMVYTFILGVFLCFMYIRLKSIIPGILLHAINNSIAFAALFLIK